MCGACCGAAAPVLIAGLSLATAASAADRIRIVAQRTGTLAWELDVIKTRGLDKAADLDIQVVELASTEAGRIALASGSADMIVSDWLFVSRERSLGSNIVFYPYSSTLGCVIAPATSEIADAADLKGKKLAIAGGPLDKNWLMLQAVARAPISTSRKRRRWCSARRRCCPRRRCRASTRRP